MMSGRLNTATSVTSDDFPFSAMQPPPYVGFEHVMAVGGAGQRPGGMQHHLYDNIDFAAAAAAAATFQFQEQHQLLTLPPNGLPMAPPPMPMPLQMPMPMPGMPGDVYSALGIVKREGGGGPDVGGGAGRIRLNLGRRTYFSPGDMLAVDRLLMRSRLGGVFGLDFGGAHLSGAKHYHRRDKVCEYHAKAAVVVAGGKQQRFCQQCSRTRGIVLGNQVVHAAQEVVRRLEDGLDVRRNPESIAAAIIYMIVQRAGAKKFVRDVSMATGVAEGTIKEAHKDLTPHAELLFG